MSNTATTARPDDATWQKAIAKALESGAMTPRRARSLGFTADMQTAWTTPAATVRHTHVINGSVRHG